MPGECHARPGRPPGRRGWREDRVPPATPHPAGREQAPCPRLARAYAVPHSTAPGTAGKLRPGERRGLVPGSRGRQNPEWGGGVRLSRPAPTPPIGFPLTIRAPEILRHLCPPLWGLFLWASPLGHRCARAHTHTNTLTSQVGNREWAQRTRAPAEVTGKEKEAGASCLLATCQGAQSMGGERDDRLMPRGLQGA